LTRQRVDLRISCSRISNFEHLAVCTQHGFGRAVMANC
jgi:hypothetical protein